MKKRPIRRAQRQTGEKEKVPIYPDSPYNALPYAHPLRTLYESEWVEEDPDKRRFQARYQRQHIPHLLAHCYATGAVLEHRLNEAQQYYDQCLADWGEKHERTRQALCRGLSIRGEYDCKVAETDAHEMRLKLAEEELEGIYAAG